MEYGFAAFSFPRSFATCLLSDPSGGIVVFLGNHPVRPALSPRTPLFPKLSAMERNGSTNCQLAEVYLQLIKATVEWDERVYRVVRITIGDWTKNKRAYCRSLLQSTPPPRLTLSFQSDTFCVHSLPRLAYCTFNSECCPVSLLNSQYVCPCVHCREHQGDTQ
ncbi:hypothetical protein ALC56_06742 [Trachymyrmex septentrionalis]|uniref:Uncharacterized protein n=1 Tax=Trachymyrmex septentrionalis TaxID=34720 RepID=A0A195FEB3_9HYME|nr:hypothetical protein ALC56_06742 [Trachymyrmex septentrionalis]